MFRGTEEEQGADSSGTLKVPFSNDGSFLENFKKLSEKFAKTAEDGTKRAAEEEVTSNRYFNSTSKNISN